MTIRRINGHPGQEIRNAIALAIALAAEENVTVEFDFENHKVVTIQVDATSNPNYIYRDWDRAVNGYLGDNPLVGPHPADELTPEEIASDAGIAAEKSLRRDAARAQA